MTLVRAMLLSVMVALAAAACGGGDDDYGLNPSSCFPSGSQICLTASTFNPSSLTITTGTTVTWRDGSNLAHTVTSDAGAPEAFNADVAPGGTFSREFNTAGTYNYHCNVHPGMTGTLTVN